MHIVRSLKNYVLLSDINVNVLLFHLWQRKVYRLYSYKVFTNTTLVSEIGNYLVFMKIIVFD
jgi:hypothetical protein